MAHGNVLAVKIENELKTSFIDYAMSVIVSRALPDVRDGLKPVHRRILYVMYLLKNYHNRPFLKSARIVGDVMGRLHPHGDTAIYDALVRLAQVFSMRYPLIDGQGNFGSIDGDSAAAMRYTESRMQALAEYMLLDIDKETVDFIPNYDNKELEPVVLPTKLPQLLINGSSGIAVGMATNIPPHNIIETLDALEALIDDPEITIDGLMEHIKAPDFPTYGQIHGTKGARDAYHTGRGSVIMRARAGIEEIPKSSGRERIVVTEIPYQINKARLIEKIAELVSEKKLEGISDIRDESSKLGIRIVIDLKKNEPGEIVLNNLFKMTPMQSSFGINMVGLIKGVPKLLNLKEILVEFYQHRREVVLRRTSYLLNKAEERAHILLGLKIAVENIDSVVALIRKAPDSQTAQQRLIEEFQLSEIQAKAVLDMRLARLTGLEREKIIFELNEVEREIADLKDILDTPERVTKIIRDDNNELREKFGDARRTEIIATVADDFTMESLIADEEVAVTITHGGYVKRTPLSAIQAQKRGGKGKSGMLTKDEDIVRDVFMTSNHQSLLCYTNKGRVYDLKVYRIPEAQLRSRGKHFANLIKFEEEERVVSVMPVAEFTEDTFVISVTEKGYVKKTDLMAYSSVRATGIIGLKLDDGDSLVGCKIVKPGEHILIATRLGKAIRFPEDDARPMGRVSRGVTGIRFSEEEDRVIGLEVLTADTDSTILSVCENGYGKRTPLDEYRVQSRGGKGIYTIKVTDRNGPVIGICQVSEKDHLMIMTSVGKIMRFTVSEIGIIGRLTQGVRLMSVSDGEKVIGLSKVVQDGEGDETAHPIIGVVQPEEGEEPTYPVSDEEE
jgi:DNA gyrase subunit A